MRDPRLVNPNDLLHMLVAEVLADGPDAARVFIGLGMACVGCPFAPFETVSEAARAYGIEPRDLATALAGASSGVSASEGLPH